MIFSSPPQFGHGSVSSSNTPQSPATSGSPNGGWVRQFIFFHGKRHPHEMSADEVRAFLTHLAAANNLAASTQNQALSALLFLYRHVLDIPLDDRIDALERLRRLLGGFFAQQRGHGGIVAVEQITGIDRNTISKGLRELRQERAWMLGRVRQAGAGRQRIEVKCPGCRRPWRRFCKMRPRAIPSRG